VAKTLNIFNCDGTNVSISDKLELQNIGIYDSGKGDKSGMIHAYDFTRRGRKFRVAKFGGNF